MEKRTTIQITNDTLKRLKTFKLIKKESYDELLNRLMNEIIRRGLKQ